MLTASQNKFDYVVTKLPESSAEIRPDVTALDSKHWAQSVVGLCTQLGDMFGLEWAQHMNLPAIIFPDIPEKPEFVLRYAQWMQAMSTRATRQQYRSQFWIPVKLTVESLEAFAQVHRYTDFAQNVGVMLVMPDVESNAESPRDFAKHLQLLHVALGLPVMALGLGCSQFLTNKKGYPTLSKWHQPLLTHILQRIGRTLRLLLQGPVAHESSILYWQYLNHFRNKDTVKAFLDTEVANLELGYLDALQRPLQPLRDHLENGTYETFEKDPVKYAQYQAALAMAFEECTSDQFVVLVVGAGRGPLVTATIEAYESLGSRAKKPITIRAVEKNPCAVIYLNTLVQCDEKWRRYQVHVLESDLRLIDIASIGGTPATHVVSELLGSFGCNELSPECLQALYRTSAVTEATVSIPTRYVSYVAPVSSTKLYQQARAQSLYPNDTETACLGRTVAMDTPYVVRTHAASQTHMEKECWEFHHPDDDSALVRSSTILFSPDVANGCGCGNGFGEYDTALAKAAQVGEEVCQVNKVVHGFLGAFVADLYVSRTTAAAVQISTAPSTNFSKGMFSWFPLYFPLNEPLTVPPHASIVVDIRRQVGTQQRVWYEWSMTVVDGERSVSSSTFSNPGGRSYEVAM